MSPRGEERNKAKLTPCAIYLVRHAIAAERGKEWPDDTKRPLTNKGAARMRQVVEGLVELGVKLDLVLTSPLVRARQTAEIVVSGMSPSPKLEVMEELAPGESASKVAAALAAHAGRSSIALVGHEPGLGELGAWLVGAHEPFVMKKGGVCQIDLASLPPAGKGQLVWLATPAMLRALGKEA